jgi:hypothetical protein
VTAREVLQKAREILTPPGAWTQGQFARNADGVGCSEYRDEAVCFCAVGALHRAAWRVNSAPEWYYDALRALIAVVGHSIGSWNDAEGRTQAEVLAAFDKAIDAA